MGRSQSFPPGWAAEGREQECGSLHPTLMVRCILKDSPHLTGKNGGLVHMFSVAWESDDARGVSS